MYINPTPALWLDSFFYKHSFLIDIGTIIFIFLSFILSFSCFIKTFDKLHKQHEKGAYFWLLLAIGTVPFISAWTISAYYQLFLGITISFPSSLDTLPLYTYFIWLCSLLYLLTKEANKRELIRFLFDILIFILIITGFMWEIFFSELVFKLSGNMFADLIILAYPVVNFATLYIVFLLYYSTRSSKKRYIYTMIAISFGFQTFADFVYIYNSVWGTSIYGKWIDPFWSISLLLKGSAGILLLYFKNSQQITTQISAKTRHYDFTAYGLLLVFIIYIILRNLANISLLEYIFFIIFFLIMIKYFIILFRKEKAFEKLHNLSKNLEKTVEDKTKELKLALEQMNKMALTDHLTGLPNRYLLYQKLEEFILEANQKKEQFAVMFLDLDGFKFVNDTAGHNAGDILLIEVANRLKKWVREQDVVARLGGDEFTILLKFTEKEQITKIAKRIINDFSKQFFIKGKEFHISTSIGISLFPLDGESPIELIKKADKAMYFAKQHGKNNFRFFYSVYERINHKINIKNKLGSALENNELAIHYQPQYDLKRIKFSDLRLC